MSRPRIELSTAAGLPAGYPVGRKVDAFADELHRVLDDVDSYAGDVQDGDPV
jgi:hypothetical protein